MNSFACAERIPASENCVDARTVAAMTTALSAHTGNGSPTHCKHVRRTLWDEDGVTVQTTCWTDQ